MRLCTRCVLPETFPGIQFDDDGVCNLCRQSPDAAKVADRKTRLRARFERQVEELRSHHGYHCLMAWSGGKDSTYTLWLLKQRYGLAVLAFTFDNCFVSPGAFKNMRRVAENLGVDHIVVKPRFELLRQVFVASMSPGLYPPRALERASGICNSCMALAKGIGMRIALEKCIPMLAYGWSPGQIPMASAYFRTNGQMLRAMVDAAKSPLLGVTNQSVDAYFPEQAHLEQAERGDGSGYPSLTAPLAFLDYDEDVAVHRIQALGWERPSDTDPNSTNCLLNSFANTVHVAQMGYHPYAMELAGLVRGGYMARQEALDRLDVAAVPEVVAAVEVKLRLPRSFRS